MPAHARNFLALLGSLLLFALLRGPAGSAAAGPRFYGSTIGPWRTALAFVRSGVCRSPAWACPGFSPRLSWRLSSSTIHSDITPAEWRRGISTVVPFPAAAAAHQLVARTARRVSYQAVLLPFPGVLGYEDPMPYWIELVRRQGRWLVDYCEPDPLL